MARNDLAQEYEVLHQPEKAQQFRKEATRAIEDTKPAKN
jgi:ribosome maturation protein Sdo1